MAGFYKKRTLVSIVITIIIMICTNKLWLAVGPVLYGLDASGNGVHNIVFNFEIFTIILVLSFLLVYKASNYVADFSEVKHKSRIDILFLTIFFIFLFVPMSRINQDKISEQENRILASWKPFIMQNGEINFNFGKDYENWFNDRFNLRTFFVYVNSAINYSVNKYRVINNKTGVFLDKQSGQMYEKYPQNYKKITNKQLETYSRNLKRFVLDCSKKGIKTYIVIVPNVNFYNRANDIIHVQKNIPQDRGQLLAEYAKDKHNLDIIYFDKQFNKLQKNQPPYYKTDHHLTDSASYVMYSYLMQKIRKDFPKLLLTPLSDFNLTKNNKIRYTFDREYKIGSEHKNLGLINEEISSTYYDYYDYKYSNKIKIEKMKRVGNYKHRNPDGHYRLLILGDSFQENLAYFLNTSFKEIYKYRTNIKPREPKGRISEFDMSFWQPHIDIIRPDIIIVIKNSAEFDFSKMYRREN